jgi:ferredoxin-NADP reductase
MNEKVAYVEQKILFVERRHEYDEVYTYIFRSEEPITYTAGQYCHIRLSGMPEGVRAVREYSFATAPHDPLIEFGIDFRSGSDYQKRLQTLKAGDVVSLFKIKNHMTWPPRFPSSYSTLGNPPREYFHFTNEEALKVKLVASGVVREPPPQKREVIMIAGGVGITPFRSMLRDRKEKKMPLQSTVIHASGSDFLYADEIHSLADEYLQTNRQEFIQSVLDAADSKKDAHYYVAGSPAFVESALAALSRKGISAESDPFKGLNEI